MKARYIAIGFGVVLILLGARCGPDLVQEELVVAASSNDVSRLKWCLLLGADVNRGSYEFPDPPITVAVYNNNVEAAGILVANGALVRLPGSLGSAWDIVRYRAQDKTKDMMPVLARAKDWRSP